MKNEPAGKHVPAAVAQAEQENQERRAALRQLLALAGPAENAARIRVLARPLDPESGAPAAPSAFPEWCDYAIVARLTTVTPAGCATILIIDGARHSVAAAEAVIAELPSLGALAEYASVTAMLDTIPRDLPEAQRAMPRILRAWRKKEQAVLAARNAQTAPAGDARQARGRAARP